MLYCTVVCISNNFKISQIEGPEEDIESLLTRATYLARLSNHQTCAVKTDICLADFYGESEASEVVSISGMWFQ